MTRSKACILLPALLAALACSCGRFGQVNQGRVVAYDPGRGLVTLISDSNYREPARPRFDVLPPVTIRVPADRREMGPAPEPGFLLAVDRQNRRFTVFDPATGSFRDIPYTPVQEFANVGLSDARVTGGNLPAVNRAAGTVTTYSATERLLLTARVAEEYLALPEETWKAGDEVRYYYKDPAQALRLMNVTKTDLNKAGK